MRMMDDQLNMRLANERMLSYLSGGFALLATILAIVGLHGVLAFIVARRTREIGIRIALGARQGTVVRLVMREMLAVILLGLAAGVDSRVPERELRRDAAVRGEGGRLAGVCAERRDAARGGGHRLVRARLAGLTHLPGARPSLRMTR